MDCENNNPEVNANRGSTEAVSDERPSFIPLPWCRWFGAILQTKSRIVRTLKETSNSNSSEFSWQRSTISGSSRKRGLRSLLMHCCQLTVMELPWQWTCAPVPNTTSWQLRLINSETRRPVRTVSRSSVWSRRKIHVERSAEARASISSRLGNSIGRRSWCLASQLSGRAERHCRKP